MVSVSKIFSVDVATFEDVALQVFDFQYKNNVVYKQYVDLLGVVAPKNILEIPFLPIEFFKNKDILSGEKKANDLIFSSSGTTTTVTSKHIVSNIDIYIESFVKGFNYFYGKPEDWDILALLPAYLEREGSSLVYMVDHLIQKTKSSKSGFYLYNFDALQAELQNVEKKTLLIGVSFALLDFAEKFTANHNLITVMETGGMKGRRKEIVREELHHTLCKSFNVSKIHSEYGMTELLSQAYSSGGGIFKTPPWMKVLIRDSHDPLSVFSNNKSGVINVIDLANINSCSFIATNDLGKLYNNGEFEVLGRFDYSDVRGCNLMVT